MIKRFLIASFLLISAVDSLAVAQIDMHSYKAIQFGMGESVFSNSQNAFNLRFHYIGDNLIPNLNYQVGLSHSFQISGRSNSYTFLHFNFGGGLTNRWTTVSLFLGPSLTLHGYESDPSVSDVITQNARIGIGINGSGSLIFKPAKHVGIGVELFGNKSSVGSEWGSLIVLHFSNTK